jgi:hypothetical protein
VSDGWFIDPTISFIELICSISGYTPALSALPWAVCFGAVPTAPVSMRFSVWSKHGARDVIALLDLASPKRAPAGIDSGMRFFQRYESFLITWPSSPWTFNLASFTGVSLKATESFI